MIKIVMFILVVTLSSCKSVEKGAADKQDKLLISMEKTPCFGACPVYKLEIFQNGVVLLKADYNLPMKGMYRANIDEEALNDIIKEFKQKKFFNFENAYTSNITDLPTTYLSFHYNDRSKKIKDYHGAPEALKQLENAIAALIDTLKWKEL